MATSRQSQALATRQRLLDVAAQLFASEGFAAVTTTGLSEAAGVTRGALYHHFANMTEVMEAVFARSEGQLVSRVSEALAEHADARARLLALGPVVLKTLADDMPMQRIVFVEAPAALGWSRWRALDGGRSLRLVAELLESLAEEGRLVVGVEPSLAAQLLLGAVNEAGMRVAATEGRDLAAVSAQLTLLCRGVLADRH
ncbi:TetR/AcrR family transcriptional regulator [Nocardia shimofusensis]|uniref:TetR/AcrR family transcriptional regulator n=1 Tax=Nocardia shimofusensis TaxID=228596 RepID=UPI000832FBDE|nr:TetR/AcrR family transcriptional regulator [Nocardia shimofusensis]